MHINSKFIGSTLILVGTTIGAGMLALPIVCADAGFCFAVLLIFLLWVLMTATALITLEVNFAFKENANSFSTMAETLLGKTGKTIAWFSLLLFLYAVIAAYIAGNGSLIAHLINPFVHLPTWSVALIYTVILGAAVFWSTRAVDHINRVLLSVKGILLISAIVFLFPHVSVVELSKDTSHLKYLFGAAPIITCAFTYHMVIPSLRNYFGSDHHKLRQIIILGTFIPLVIYLIWLYVVLGTVPLNGANGFIALIKNHGSIGELVHAIDIKVHNNKLVNFNINGFANIAMTTSFLGVSLGLFDFLADGFKLSNTRWGRLQTALLTYIPPMIFALFYPHGFVMALGYAAIFTAVLYIIYPALMAYKLRKHATLKSGYHFCGNNFCLFVIIAAGVAIIVLQILNSLNLLPHL